MVCNRCIMVVREQFERAGIKPVHVNMGEVELEKPITQEKSKKLAVRLLELGFEILDDKRQKQIETIKKLLIEKVQSGEIEEHFSISSFLSKKVNKEYSHLSRLFSEVE